MTDRKTKPITQAKFLLNTDGVYHINIYSKGNTELGRLLSNFSDLEVDTIFGKFRSIEGLWYWLLTGQKHNEFKSLVGFQAKALGRDLLSDQSEWIQTPQDKLVIIQAMISKLLLNKKLLDLFLKNKLEYKHYYVYGDKVVEPTEGKWIINMWSTLQSILVK